MKASDYTKQTTLGVGVVDLKQKAKSCGKENCAQCPHGGFWYAYVPVLAASGFKRREVYLGREWTEADLRAKIAPLLVPGKRQEFMQVIDRTLRDERIAWLKRNLEQIEAAIKDVTARHIKEIARLRSDEDKLRSELKMLEKGASRAGKK